MADLVLGVKLKYQLGASLPKPVSFPFESIGDYRPVTRIPKYDFSLEKQIMKEIAKQKQADQYNSLKQAQQQLAMVDLIASRKTRHKGKEPDRSFPPASDTSIAGGTLTKPSSDSGVSRLQQSTSSSVPDQGSKHAGSSGAATSQHGADNAPASTADVSSTVHPERSHSAGPAIPTTSVVETPAETLPATANAPATDGTASSSTTNTSYVLSTYPSASFGPPVQPNQRPNYMQYVPSTGPLYQQQVRPQMQSQYHNPNTQLPQQQQQQQYPGNVSSGFVPNPQTAIQQQPQYSQQTQPMAMSTSAPVFGPRPPATAGPVTASAAFSPAQQPLYQSYTQSQPALSTPPVNWQSPAPQKETSAPVQPALPPKPDEWRVHPSGSGSQPASVPPLSHGESVPALPARNQPQQSDGSVPPAIPPKPYMAFSEFDYASDDHSALGSSSQTGHVEQLNTLLSMGFSRPQAIHALEMYDYDVNKASNYLIDKAFH